MEPNALLLLKTQTALSSGNLDEAEHLCGILLNHTPPPPHAFLLMGIINNRRGRPEAALPHLERAKEADPNSSDVLLWLSRTLKKVGRLPEALDHAIQANRKKPSDPSILHQLGSCQMDCEQYASAAESYRAAIALDGNAAVLHYRLGLALLEAGEPGGAVGAFRECLRLDPSSDTVKAALHAASIQLANALQRVGKLEDALAIALAAVREVPSDPESHVQLGAIYLDLCRYPEAIQAFRRALEINPRQVFAHRALAQALHRTGDAKEELKVLAQARRLDPESTTIRRSLVEAHLALQQVEAARLEAIALVAERPTSIEARCVLAECHLLDQRFDLAESEVTEALKVEPQNGHEAFRLGALLRTQGRMDDAVQLMRKSIELEPNQGAAYALLSYVTKAGEHDRSRIERMKRLSTDAALATAERAELHYGLGRCHEDLKDYETAMAHFDEANKLTYLDRFGRSKFDLERSANFRDRLITAFSSERGAACASTPLESNLPIFVFGMMRSGTTLADQILSSHCEFGSIGEDPFWVNNAPPFLDAAPDNISRQRLRELGERYLFHLEKGAGGKRRMIDKTPANYAFAPFIHSILPNAKFIHMIRSPADTCLSIYTTMNRVRNNWAHHKANIACTYRNYQAIMECWRKLLPPGTMMEVRYEDLVADTERITREMVAFCGLDWDDACLRPESNKRSVRTPSAEQVRQAVYASSVGRWKCYEPWISEFLLLGERPANGTGR